MKCSYLGAAAALVLALAGCGGKAQYTVKGTITGLNNAGLVLANGSDTVSVPAGATSFALGRQIDYGAVFTVTVQSQPAHMTCSVVNPTDSAGHTVEIDVVVNCTQNSYQLSGQFTGITAKADGTARSVTLLNGSTGGSAVVSSTADGTGDFAFSTLVYDGQSYGVTVVPPDNGLSCTITNGSGVMHETAVSNLLLTCVPVSN